MYRDGSIVCDSCQTAITKVVPPPEGGWPNLHSLCSACFDRMRQTS